MSHAVSYAGQGRSGKSGVLIAASSTVFPVGNPSRSRCIDVNSFLGWWTQSFYRFNNGLRIWPEAPLADCFSLRRFSVIKGVPIHPWDGLVQGASKNRPGRDFLIGAAQAGK